jgi:hypothetical protein
VTTAIGSEEQDQDLGQSFELAAHFAANGDNDMKRAMYAAFERMGFREAGLACAEQLVVLDGLTELRFALTNFGTLEAVFPLSDKCG